ncbi:germ cell-less protein-like 1 [Acomys russatus]|uniref:germ cell-less protein-like 1 n=1 Tax=Acomys russatus TaxID=60746 RepID=UPI0021E2BFCA|nr:germ cell-less protein-like 1 [Acomys russatus]XP_050997749.1 germ cell-less protein-like 1 [Acomys russatus]
MGTVSSRIRSRLNPAAEEEPPAGGNEEEERAEAGAAVVPEEQAGHSGTVATARQPGRKRKAGPGGTLAKVPHRALTREELLFLRGEDSDVKICAFQEEWCLHRAYLCRSGYFSSMFSGAWRETNMSTIEMQMPDENIDRDSFHEVLGFLYLRTIEIPPCRVVATLAAASMLQLDEVIRQCEVIMMTSVNAETVCTYYYSAEIYGLLSIRYMCRQWLLDNLMIWQNDEILLEINLDLMKELIASSDLLVVEVEMDVYTTLKKWMFLQLELNSTGSQEGLLPIEHLCFAKYKSGSDGTHFLDCEQGRAFVPVFQQLRLAYIICDPPSAHIIDQDELIPATWLTHIYKEQWLTLIQAEQNSDVGPMDVYMSDIYGNSMRCGGKICIGEERSWTWTGFNFAWDLVVCYTNQRIIFRRCALNDSCGLGVNLLWQRKVAFRLRVISLDETGKEVFKMETDYHVLSLRKNQELRVISLDNQDTRFPMYVACNFLYLPRETASCSGTSRSPR